MYFYLKLHKNTNSANFGSFENARLVPRTKSPISCAPSFSYLYQIEIYHSTYNNVFEKNGFNINSTWISLQKIQFVIMVTGQNDYVLAFFSEKDSGYQLKFVKKLH